MSENESNYCLMGVIVALHDPLPLTPRTKRQRVRAWLSRNRLYVHRGPCHCSCEEW